MRSTSTQKLNLCWNTIFRSQVTKTQSDASWKPICWVIISQIGLWYPTNKEPPAHCYQNKQHCWKYLSVKTIYHVNKIKKALAIYWKPKIALMLTFLPVVAPQVFIAATSDPTSYDKVSFQFSVLQFHQTCVSRCGNGTRLTNGTTQTLFNMPWRAKMRPESVWYSRLASDRFLSSYDALSGNIMGMGTANERRRYNKTSPLIGWAHTQNDPWLCFRNPTRHETPSMWKEHLLSLVMEY